MRKSRTEPIASGARPAIRKRSTRRPPGQVGRASKGLVLAARSFAAKVMSLELSDDAAAALAARWRLEIDAQERKVLQWFAPAKQAAFKAHAAICRQENEALAPYREARRAINAKLARWRAAQVEDFAATDRELPQVHRGPDAEHDDAASAACPARVEGVSFRENWRAEVIDKAAFVQAVAARPELINLVDPNLAALGHLARAHKRDLDIQGVRVCCELSVTASGRT